MVDVCTLCLAESPKEKPQVKFSLAMSNSTIAAKAHAGRVAAVSRSVRTFYEKKVPFQIFHGSSNSTRAAARQ